MRVRQHLGDALLCGRKRGVRSVLGLDQDLFYGLADSLDSLEQRLGREGGLETRHRVQVGPLTRRSPTASVS